MQIRPFGSRILIKPAAKTQVLVSDQGTLCEYGTVVAIGNDVVHVKVGDSVGFVVWGVEKLDVRDEIFYFIDEKSDYILGFIEEDGLQSE